MVHCGESEEKWKLLHERLQRIDFLSDKQLNHELQLKNYSGILVDEAHLLTLEKLEILLELSEHQQVIFSSDSEDMISPDEMDRSVMERIENLPQIQSFHLTNRIRTNAELSSFIQNILHLPDKKGTRNYPHVDVVYANEKKETENLLKDYIRQGYEYQKNKGQIKENKETEQLVMVLDDAYYYDEKGYIRTNVCKEEGKQEVRSLFHQLNQAKERLTLIIEKNEEVYEKMKDDPNSLKGEYVVLINNEREKENESDVSVEALLVDLIIKNKCSLKEAIKLLNEENKDLSKKDIYNASLNLKNILKR